MSFKHLMQSAIIVISMLALSKAAPTPAIPENSYSGLKWRLVGPMRAGWSTCAAGDPTEPGTFYFGAADGGVWKTTDVGRTWAPLFDRATVASVGALVLAPSDPNIIYVGTGQVETRYDIAAGNGVYRSRDGGKSWEHLGLDETRHIGRIVVDPRNPDTALVAAMGHVFGPSIERGVFRTADGGKTWQKVLYKDENTGAVDLAADPAMPDVVYAALWQARCYPWQSYFTPLAGPGSGIYKSSDGGKNWAPLTRHGLPEGPLGRIGLALAPGTRGTRVYAVISAENGSGLYRSDNGGEDWLKVNDDASLADWYFGRLTVDPRDPDTVYVMGRSVRKSADAGRTFTFFKGAPGGDDYHFLWIHPRDPLRMILASDQGTVITVNGGKNWSSWYNQPTGQFYHLAVDERFPYWIYSGQQDSGTAAVASHSDYGQLTFRDWHPVGGDERDYDIPDPADPDIVYGSGLGGRLSRFDTRTGQVQNISPWPVSTYGARPTAVRYRYDWITPLAISRSAPYSIFLGSQFLFRSDDRGQNWTTVSPDLTGAVEGTKNCGDSVPIDRARACGYGVIYAIALSPKGNGEIWVGTDSGLIQLTRDAGKTWQNVTPPGLSDWSKVAQIDASAADPATAYAAIDRHRLDDYGPHAFRTHDYGKTWADISGDMPRDCYVNVVRQDPVEPKLLFAGTSRGALVSFDDGDHWQQLQLNLPPGGVNDLAIHGNDLVAATQGRAIWIMDEISPLRRLGTEVTGSDAFLFPPSAAYRLRQNENRDTPLPYDEPILPDAPAGAVIDYYLGTAPKEPVVLEIMDSTGSLVRRFSSDDEPPGLRAEQYFANLWLTPHDPLPASLGHNRFVWSLRCARPQAIQYDFSIAAMPGNTPLLPEGALVLPGQYQVRLTVGGRKYSQPLDVVMDPRVKITSAALADQLDIERRIADAMAQSSSAHAEVSAIAARLKNVTGKMRASKELTSLLSAAQSVAADLEKFRTGETADNLAEINSVLGGLETDIESADRAPTTPQQDVLKMYAQQLDTALAHWKQLRSGPVAELDGKIRSAGLPSIMSDSGKQ